MPANSREYMREYMQQYRQAGRDHHTRPARSRVLPFVGCDGEGATLDNGYHAYNLLRIGSDFIVPSGIQVRLTTRECLDFISRCDPDNVYVGYFFDYDVTKILEDLPMPKLHRLINRRLRMGMNGMLFPVDYEDYQVEYLPRKEFKVRRKIAETEDDTTWSKWVVINDVGSFFQMPFLNAIKLWGVGTEKDWEDIEAGKRQRATFTVADFHEIATYNALEIALLETLMENFRTACINAGYVPRRWQGPGLLAEAMFRAHGVRRSSDTPILSSDDTAGLVSFATSAYYGGRTEVASIGPVNAPVYQKDINSAYPHAMRFVPCLMHGGWEYVTGSAVDAIDFNFDTPTGIKGERYAIEYGRFTGDGTSHTLWYGLPIRTKSGTIVFPASGMGWYWSFEIQSAIHQTFTTEELWIYTRQCDCAPLAYVEGIYAERQRIGKDGPGIVLKLGLNSKYGKTVQSIGSPKYANPIWGSFITAFTRMMINNFIHESEYCDMGKCGYDVLMVATDSVATLSKRNDYPKSEKLGEWSTEVHPGGIFVVQPGVYFGTSGKPSKTRGVPRTIIDAYEPVFRDAFDTMVETKEMSDGTVSVPQKIFVGIRYALHRRNLKLLGQWIEFGELESTGKVVSFDWTSKRAHAPALPPSNERSYIQTFPYKGRTNICTVPYSKDIGGLLAREESRIAFEGQPDWGGIDYGIVGEDSSF